MFIKRPMYQSAQYRLNYKHDQYLFIDLQVYITNV